MNTTTRTADLIAAENRYDRMCRNEEATREEVIAATNALHEAQAAAHQPKITYHQPSDSYRAACPDCEWATAPSLNTATLHAAADAHHTTAA